MYSSLLGRGGWVGAVCTFWYECPLVVLACESLHVFTVCIWRCEHARFYVEVFYALYINVHSFIHSLLISSARLSTETVPVSLTLPAPSVNLANVRELRQRSVEAARKH